MKSQCNVCDGETYSACATCADALARRDADAAKWRAIEAHVTAYAHACRAVPRWYGELPLLVAEQTKTADELAAAHRAFMAQLKAQDALLDAAIKVTP